MSPNTIHAAAPITPDAPTKNSANKTTVTNKIDNNTI